MPHDVTMPQLGMAQDAGKIVAWLKAPGDPVAKGDALFEVETDKATMEVEAQAAGFLTGVVAQAGDDVPVGQVIARISDSADDEPAQDASNEAPDADDLPEGRSVTMPQLGMAQNSGLLVSWLKAPGDTVVADDVLFEVETDKSTMEVPAGIDGYLAATLAEAGQEVPVGSAVAIISATRPNTPVARSYTAATTPVPTPPTQAPQVMEKPKAAPKSQSRPAPLKSGEGRILASPKVRRLAFERGLDLARLAEAGHPQPYHVADLDTLAAMPAAPFATAITAAPAARRLTAELTGDGLGDFAEWARKTAGLDDPDAILAGFAGASMPGGKPVNIAVERFGVIRVFSVPEARNLSLVTRIDGNPILLLRDLRGTRLRQIELGADDMPVLTIADAGSGLALTLECTPQQLEARDAITLLTEFAGRLEQPVRHLL